MASLVRAYERLLSASAVAAGVMLVAIASMICADVVLRVVGVGKGIPGVIEFTEYSLYGITVLGAGWALRLGAHVAVEFVVDALPRTPRRLAGWLAGGIGLAASLTLVYAGTLATWRSFEGARLVFRTYIFSEWWLLAPLPFGALLLSIEFMRILAKGPETPESRQPPGPGGA